LLSPHVLLLLEIYYMHIAQSFFFFFPSYC
jgi:hypothetical protein